MQYADMQGMQYMQIYAVE